MSGSDGVGGVGGAWNKALDTAAMGAVKAGKGLAAGAEKAGKLGSSACKWIFEKGGGVVEAATSKYHEIQGKGKSSSESSDHPSEIKGKRLSTEDLSQSAESAEIEDTEEEEEQLEMRHEKFTDKASEMYEGLSNHAGEIKDHIKARVGEFGEGVSQKMGEYEEVQKLKDISKTAGDAIMGLVQFVYKTPGTIVDAVQKRAEKAEIQKDSDELRNLQEGFKQKL